MKRNWTKLIFGALLCVASLSAFSSPQSFDQDNNRRGVEKNDAEEQEPNLDGVVEVSFKIDQMGKVQILNINSTSPQLSEYVIKKLSKIQLEEGNSQVGKVIKYRFVFKKQA
ncbi:MAG: hypothetical protein K1X54_03280 [Flavobacteriales bacterium]|nr:hypothetical protein [Flavobacteriales bacterium]